MQSNTLMVDDQHLIKSHNPKEPHLVRLSDKHQGHDWWMYHNHCNRIGEEDLSETSGVNRRGCTMVNRQCSGDKGYGGSNGKCSILGICLIKRN